MAHICACGEQKSIDDIQIHGPIVDTEWYMCTPLASGMKQRNRLKDEILHLADCEYVYNKDRT